MEKQSENISTSSAGTSSGSSPVTSNRAKIYQLVLFPMNNGATNVYYILTMNFIAYYANGVLGLLLAFATTMVTLMRVLDAFIDPVIGAIMDRTSTRWGKFRPFMVLGNGIMIVASLIMFFGLRLIPENVMWWATRSRHPSPVPGRPVLPMIRSSARCLRSSIQWRA